LLQRESINPLNWKETTGTIPSLSWYASVTGRCKIPAEIISFQQSRQLKLVLQLQKSGGELKPV